MYIRIHPAGYSFLSRILCIYTKIDRELFDLVLFITHFVVKHAFRIRENILLRLHV